MTSDGGDGRAAAKSAAAQSAPRPVAELLDGDLPRWEAIDFELSCSRCGYDLQRLTSYRCPECGLELDWREVLDQRLYRTDWLFEHCWKRRPIRSWLVTVWRSLWPRSFWKRVSIHQHFDKAPLWLLILIAPVLMYGLLLGVPFALSHALAAALPLTGTPWSSPGFLPFGMAPRTSLQATILELSARLIRLSDSLLDEPIESAAIVLGCGLLTQLGALACVAGLRQTLASRRLRLDQLLRTFAHAVSAPALLTGASTAGIEIVLFTTGWNPYSQSSLPQFLLSVLPALFGWAIYALYLAVGLQHYLRLPHAPPVAILACLVSVLFLLTVPVVVLWVIAETGAA